MSNPIQSISRLIRFLTHDIWSYTNDDVRGVYRWLINTIKAVILSVRFFSAHRVMERASALTYYTLLAIVPMLALLLSIGRVIGVQDMLWQSIENDNQAHSEALRYLFQFAESYINQANNGLIMGVGIVMLLYVVFSLMGKVEAVMNEIWQQKNGRSALRQVTDYLSLIILVPLSLLVIFGVQIYLQTYVVKDKELQEISGLLLWLLKAIPYVLTFVMLTLTYIVIPNCTVRIRNAFAAALVAGSIFLLFQYIYISGQIWVSKYSAVYGSFAAVPLLLLWLQSSWVICLYGAELSYASQNIQHYNFENVETELSRQDRDFLMLLISSVVYRKFKLQEPAPTTEELSEELHLPSRATADLVRELCDVGLISPRPREDDRKISGWRPEQESDKATVSMLFDRLATQGVNKLKYDYKKLFAKEWEVFSKMHQSALTEGKDLLLRDISTDQFKLSIEHTVQMARSSNQNNNKKKSPKK